MARVHRIAVHVVKNPIRIPGRAPERERTQPGAVIRKTALKIFRCAAVE